MAATPKCPRVLGVNHSTGWSYRCGVDLRVFGGAWGCPLHGRVEFSEVAWLPLVSGQRR